MPRSNLDHACWAPRVLCVSSTCAKLPQAVTQTKLGRLTYGRQRVRKIQTRARYGRRRLKRISRTATLGGLFLSFLKIGITGFGGGFAVLSHIRNVVVHERGWLGEHDFIEALALGQSLPGTSAGNAVTYMGFRLPLSVGLILAGQCSLSLSSAHRRNQSAR